MFFSFDITKVGRTGVTKTDHCDFGRFDCDFGSDSPDFGNSMVHRKRTLRLLRDILLRKRVTNKKEHARQGCSFILN